MKVKKVQIRSHSPLAFDARCEVGWEDLWLRLYSGRRALKLAPCLVSYEHLLGDHEMNRTMKSKDLFKDMVEEGEETLKLLETQDIVLRPGFEAIRKGEDPGRDYVFANIFTRRNWIDRAEAERMLDAYLAILGIRGSVYQWKRPTLIVMPTTITKGQILDLREAS